MDDDDFERLLGACVELAELFPHGLVYIGGIAVYLHAVNVAATRKYAAFTHDADFYISLADMADLRDLEEVTPNRRLSKHQLIKAGFEFDIYTERQSTLLVPFGAVFAASEVVEGVRLASLEHLLVLKLEAYRDRRASAKGSKDAEDVIRIAATAAARRRPFRGGLAAPYLDDEHVGLIEQVRRGTHAMSLARGNAVEAKKLRAAVDALLREILGA